MTLDVSGTVAVLDVVHGTCLNLGKLNVEGPFAVCEFAQVVVSAPPGEAPPSRASSEATTPRFNNALTAALAAKSDNVDSGA